VSVIGGSSLAIADGVSLATHLSTAQSLEDGLAVWNAECIGEGRAMLSQTMGIQENTLTHPPDLGAANEDEIESWIGSFIPPGAQQEVRVFGNEEQAPIFES